MSTGDLPFSRVSLPFPQASPLESRCCFFPAFLILQILIVGAGFGGLACAIQSRIEGHDVHIFEQFDQMLKLGISLPLTATADNRRLYRNIPQCRSLLPPMGYSR